jgi:hypothetical protein
MCHADPDELQVFDQSSLEIALTTVEFARPFWTLKLLQRPSSGVGVVRFIVIVTKSRLPYD